jgi:hypothetical protein
MLVPLPVLNRTVKGIRLILPSEVFPGSLGNLLGGKFVRKRKESCSVIVEPWNDKVAFSKIGPISLSFHITKMKKRLPMKEL